MTRDEIIINLTKYLSCNQSICFLSDDCKKCEYALTEAELNNTLDAAIEALQNIPTQKPGTSEEPKTADSGSTTCKNGENMHVKTTDDLISRQAVFDAIANETVNTNPHDFKANESFIQYIDDDKISSFGRWQWANGFNTALTVLRLAVKEVASAHPERVIS